MGVCGNAAELVAALTAAKSHRSRILSLQGKQQGHVVASAQRADGRWALLDGLYNILVDGDIPEIMARVREDPDYLDIRAFDGVKVPYRYFFDASNFAYQIETTGGIRFDREYVADRGISFDDLQFPCNEQMDNEVQKQAATILSNVFFVRATYERDGHWAPWAYSYFVSRPSLKSGQAYEDHARDIWGDGLNVPESFAGGKKLPMDEGEAISSATEDGYSSAHAFMRDGRTWLSKVAPGAAEAPFIGYDFGAESMEAVAAVRVRWSTPAATPGEVVIESSHEGQQWREAARFAIARAAATNRVDILELPTAVKARFWRLRPTAVTAFGVEYIDFLAAASPPTRSGGGVAGPAHLNSGPWPRSGTTSWRATPPTRPAR